MTFHDEIAALQARIAKAHIERDTWRATGQQDKYLESHSMIEALELRLQALRQEGLRQQAARDFASDDARVARRKSGDAPGGPAEVPGGHAQVMAEFAITYDGRQYQYDRYRYDSLEDAVAYARLRHSAPSSEDTAVAIPAARAVEAPDEAQREAMRGLGITFEDGIYRLGAYRYERLADALSYARLLRLQRS